MDVIVVGAGIGELTAALTRARAGLEVRVFEQAPVLREVGAGIQGGLQSPAPALGARVPGPGRVRGQDTARSDRAARGCRGAGMIARRGWLRTSRAVESSQTRLVEGSRYLTASPEIRPRGTTSHESDDVVFKSEKPRCGTLRSTPSRHHFPCLTSGVHSNERRDKEVSREMTSREREATRPRVRPTGAWTEHRQRRSRAWPSPDWRDTPPHAPRRCSGRDRPIGPVRTRRGDSGRSRR